MPNRLLYSAKWRTQPHPTGVQRYAAGLCAAMKADGLGFDLAQPSSDTRWRSMIWEQRTLPTLARNYDTLFCPANMAPLQLDHSVRLLLTVHCLRFMFHPENYTPPFVRWYTFAMPRLIERAYTVFTVSDAQRAEIESVYPESVGKVSVMPPGVESEFHTHHPRHPLAPAGPYLVYIGSAAPAKNLSTVLNAFRQLDQPPKLVLIGIDAREADLICPASIRHAVRPIGHLSDTSAIAALLANAQALLAPSRYESFGLPCLEAMASGCPVIASDLPAHREVCRGAATYAEHDHPDAWRSAIEGLLNNPSLHTQMREKGLIRSRAFDWQSSIRTLKRVLKSHDEAIV